MAEIKINNMIVSNDIITNISNTKRIEITYDDNSKEIFYIPILPVEESENQ